MSTQDTLIDLFAGKHCNNIGESDITRAFRKNNLADVQALPDYNGTHARVRKAKRKIEIIADGYPDNSDQALQCLAELNECRAESSYLTEEFKIIRDLIEKTLYRNWSGLQAEYDLRRQVIEAWNDVFVSYTNRDAVATNQTYQDLILHEWGAEIDPARDKHNYIARTLAKYLEQNHVRGFIDYQQLQCGDNIPNEIRQHAAESMALVQLLEPAIFQEPPPPKRNWCLEEYNAFTQNDPPKANLATLHNRYFFVLARGGEISEIIPPGYPPVYRAWIERASDDLRLTLNEYPLRFDELRVAVKDIARQILDAREKLVDAMLASWE